MAMLQSFLVQERSEDVLNDFFNQFRDTTVSLWDAVVVQKEVQEALEVQKDLAIKARRSKSQKSRRASRQLG